MLLLVLAIIYKLNRRTVSDSFNGSWAFGEAQKTHLDIENQILLQEKPRPGYWILYWVGKENFASQRTG
jgi:hypothetical protein